MDEVGRQVKRLREERGWNQAKLAVVAGMAPSAVNQIENGKRAPSANSLSKLAAALEVEVPDLFPKGRAPLSLEWARTASDAEFNQIIEAAAEEDTEQLNRLSGTLARFISRPVRRILTERNGKTFTDHGPEPKGDEEERLRERLEALKAEMRLRRPPVVRMRMSDEGNVCFWFIPPDEREEHRPAVDEFFGGELYEDIDARSEAQVYEEVLLYV